MSGFDERVIREYLTEDRASAISRVQMTSRLLKVDSPVLTRTEMRAICKLTEAKSFEEARKKLAVLK